MKLCCFCALVLKHNYVFLHLCKAVSFSCHLKKKKKLLSVKFLNVKLTLVIQL